MQELLRNGGSFSGRERNCCFLNIGNGEFGDVSAVSGLDFADDARAAVPLDWDHDGDLDLWVLNRSGPQIRFLRNQYRGSNRSVMIRLVGTESNRDAVGARLAMTVRRGGKTHRILRTLRAGDGYLSQRSKWLHFGLGAGEEVDNLSIRWPSGNSQDIESLKVGGRYVIQEMSPPTVLVARKQNGTTKSAPGPPPAAPDSRSRTMLANPLPIPAWDTWPASDRSNGGSPSTASRNQCTLLTLWSAACRPCLGELKEMAANTAALERASLVVQPLCIDDRQKTSEQADRILRDLGWKQTARFASADLLGQLQLIHDELFDLHDALPLPCSFLIDQQGRLSVIYKGVIDLEELLQDVKSVGLPPAKRRDLGAEFQGKWSAAVRSLPPSSLAMAMLDEGWAKEALEYADRFHDAFEQDSNYYVLLYSLGQRLTRGNQHREAAELYRRAVEQKPDLASGHFNLGLTLRLLGQLEPAAIHLAKAAESDPTDHRTRLELGKTLSRMGRLDQGKTELARAIELQSDYADAHFEFALNCALRGDIEIGIEHLNQAARIQPNPFSDVRHRNQFRKAGRIGLERLRKQGTNIERLERLLGQMASG
ncbi:ASPIC/UnbV domain-containing protein [Pirellulales bacterium]|nr:ASPIC/UnbV domain-containing protein [Pirellulales bacterium]